MTTYGSIFTGIGGLDLAIEEVFGAEPRWFCEKDPQARKVLARHWPDVPVFEDVKAVDWARVEPVDIICGGPPCQSVSVAGKRLGPADPRFLWPDALRVVRALRPRLVVFENPTGLFPWLGGVLGGLAEIGYVGRYGCVTAADVGAAHKRERIFIVATPADAPHSPHHRCNGSTGPESTGGGDDSMSLLPTLNTRDRYIPKPGRLAASLARTAGSIATAATTGRRSPGGPESSDAPLLGSATSGDD